VQSGHTMNPLAQETEADALRAKVFELETELSICQHWHEKCTLDARKLTRQLEECCQELGDWEDNAQRCGYSYPSCMR
jgi:hypothetical protein